MQSVGSVLTDAGDLLSFLKLPGYGIGDVQARQRACYTRSGRLAGTRCLQLLTTSGGGRRLGLMLRAVYNANVQISRLQCFAIRTVHRNRMAISYGDGAQAVLIPNGLGAVLLGCTGQQNVVANTVFIAQAYGPLGHDGV